MKKERRGVIPKIKNALLSILVKDYEELTDMELHVLRNATRENYHLSTEYKFNRQNLLFPYLMLKRKFITELETILVSPQLMEFQSGVFSPSQQIKCSGAVPTYDGLWGSQIGRFVVRGDSYLPLMTVFYFDDYTEIICLTPTGEFCRLNNKEFNFEI